MNFIFPSSKQYCKAVIANSDKSLSFFLMMKVINIIILQISTILNRPIKEEAPKKYRMIF